jgi:hypothetical protein
MGETRNWAAREPGPKWKMGQCGRKEKEKDACDRRGQIDLRAKRILGSRTILLNLNLGFGFTNQRF